MIDRYLKILEKIKSNELILLDGAIGTELQKRGIVMDGSWCGTASLQDNILKQIHIDYIHSGSQICLLYTSPSPRDLSTSRMPSSA